MEYQMHQNEILKARGHGKPRPLTTDTGKSWVVPFQQQQARIETSGEGPERFFAVPVAKEHERGLHGDKSLEIHIIHEIVNYDVVKGQIFPENDL